MWDLGLRVGEVDEAFGFRAVVVLACLACSGSFVTSAADYWSPVCFEARLTYTLTLERHKGKAEPGTPTPSDRQTLSPKHSTLNHQIPKRNQTGKAKQDGVVGWPGTYGMR